MKKILLAIGAFSLSLAVIAQAPVPNSWDGTDVNTLPMGYSIGGGSFGPPSNYTQLGINGGACMKLNSTGHFLEIHLAAEAGAFSYYARGTNPPSSGSPFDGQFDIEISDDGSTWTPKRSIINNAMNVNAQQLYTDTVLPSTRYIRFIFSRKESGFNVALDEINVGAPLAKPEAEINAVIDADTIFSGGTYFTSETVATTKRINVLIENKGTDSTLLISGVTSSNAGEFTVAGFAPSVAPLSNDTIKVDFTPSVAGTRQTVLTIANNDASENPYIINITGYGDGLATEPGAVTSVNLTNGKTYTYDASFTPNAVPLSDEAYLVLFSKSTITTGPSDGIAYTAGDMIAGAKVAYVGANSTYEPKEVIANTTYNVAVYSYSGRGVYTNYASTAAIASITTPATMQTPTYYNTLNTGATSFLTDLSALTNPHTLAFYSDFDDTYIKEFGSRDTTNGQKVVTCRYTSDEYIYNEPFAFSYITREHSYPQSWMPTEGTGAFQSLPEYSDYHNLFPVNQNDANAVRSNNPLGEVVNVISSFKDGTYGTDTAGNAVYEPRDSHKGDAARAIFYQAVTYDGISGNNWAFPNPIVFKNYTQNQDVLKKWHWQDPVSDWEIARNDYIASIQGNRNPFIDSMQYACYIDFSTMTRVVTSAPCSSTPVGIDEISNLKTLAVYPNPAKDAVFVQYELVNDESTSISLIDVYGKTIQSINAGNSSVVNKRIDLTNVANGVYFIKIKGEKVNKSTKFIKK